MKSDVTTALKGRDVPMDILRGALGQAAAGRGRLAVVSGDAGIGKSTIASVLAAEAEAAGAEVVWGRAWEFADAPPYFPVRGALRALGIEPRDRDFRDQGGAFRLWEAVVDALASSKKTVVWVLEDLHAADLLTLDLLTFLAQPLRGLPVLVLGTARAKDPRIDERASQRLTRMARDGIDLRLTPLTTNEVGAVAERVCGGPLPPAAVSKLAELTGGNPLFVVECARSFKSSGTLGSLPPTVRQVVLERFAVLPDATRTALTYGAVIGREFTAALVARMQETLPARIIDTVLPALRAGLISEVELGRFAFSHVIVRDAVEDCLSAEERARVHALADAALEVSGDSVEVAVERARHALAASALCDVRRAVDLARRAIRVLEDEGAHDRAYAVCERLLAATATAEVASALTTDDWMVHARIAHAAGRSTESRRLCDRVIGSARAANDKVTFARAALLVGAEIRAGFVDRTLVDLLEEAKAMLGHGEPALACRVQARLAAALQPHVDCAVPMVMARDAIARARSLGDDVLLEVLDTAVSALVDFAPVEERIAAYEELLSRAAAAGDRPRLLRAHARLATDHAFIGDFDAFSRDVDASLRVAAELGHPRFRWRALLLSSMRALALGDLLESERALVEVRELAALIDDPGLLLSLRMHSLHRAMVAHRMGVEEGELRQLAAEVPGYFAGMPLGDAFGAGYCAVIFARLEDEDATKAALRRLGDNVRYFERETTATAMLAEAFAFVSSDEVCRRFRVLLEPHAALHCVGGHLPVSYEGPIARSLALLDASLGDFDGAAQRLEAAILQARARGHRSWIARMEYDLARVLHKAGRIDDARAHAETAAALAIELRMDALATLARSIAADATPIANQPTSAAIVPARATLAFASEGDVWRLSYGERTVRVRDSRGMQLLARLVERAGDEVHVLALAGDEGGSSVAETSAGDMLDETARRAYRARLNALASDIDEAELHNDRGRMERLGQEKAMLEEELARAVGLGGRSRQSGSSTERARVNVQRRLKDAIMRVSEVDAAIGRFLARAVRTGTFCCFRP